MSSSNCCFLTCIQISQEVSQLVWYSHLFQNFSQFIVIHTVKGFGIVNKAEIDVFLELSCFFDDPVDVGNLISGSSAFSKTSLNIWKFTVHMFLKPGLENFEHYFPRVRDECNCAGVWVNFPINLCKKHTCICHLYMIHIIYTLKTCHSNGYEKTFKLSSSQLLAMFYTFSPASWLYGFSSINCWFLFLPIFKWSWWFLIRLE